MTICIAFDLQVNVEGTLPNSMTRLPVGCSVWNRRGEGSSGPVHGIWISREERGMGGQHNYFGLWVDSNFGTQQGQALVYHLQQPSTLCQGRLGELMPWRCGCWGTSRRRTFQDKEEHFRC
ncbi:MTOR-associated protein MEAK7-like [Huso huso]|uniref:MTOR-associated protein MEAK7-like n=1 Tax=Huso huso TaxID=61971 RepID=A0ABR0Z555_HUSHU